MKLYLETDQLIEKSQLYKGSQHTATPKSPKMTKGERNSPQTAALDKTHAHVASDHPRITNLRISGVCPIVPIRV